MTDLTDLFQRNRAWRDARLHEDPRYFEQLASQHAPKYLWIGCADARVPANEIIGLPPGEVFVHRNVANVVVHSDFNCQSVIQFAVDVLKVEHILVVGHYGCAGVGAVVKGVRVGLVDNWLYHVRDVFNRHAEALTRIEDPGERHDRLCELNVLEQVAHVCQSGVVVDAWQRGQKLSVHACIYGLSDGLLRDLGLTVSSPEALAASRTEAVESALSGRSAVPAAVATGMP